MAGVRATPAAVLAHCHPIGIVALALVGLVVAPFALLASERDGDSNVSAGHCEIPAWWLIAAPGEEKPRPARGSSSLARSGATAAGGACRALRLFDRAPGTQSSCCARRPARATSAAGRHPARDRGGGAHVDALVGGALTDGAHPARHEERRGARTARIACSSSSAAPSGWRTAAGRGAAHWEKRRGAGALRRQL